LISTLTAEWATIFRVPIRERKSAASKEIRMPGEHLDLTSDPEPNSANGARHSGSRRFVGVHFVCCDVYSRVYINRDESAYEGNCPKCAKRVRLRIGPEGTDARFFTAG
jgi:hypothetical protein